VTLSAQPGDRQEKCGQNAAPAPGAFREALAARDYRLRRVRATHGSELVTVPRGRAVVLHDATLRVLPNAIRMLGVRLASIGSTLARLG
jgi:hypothetical protein